MIITLCIDSLSSTIVALLVLQLITPVHAVELTIEKVSIRNAHSIHTSVLIIIITHIRLQHITVLFIFSSVTVRNTIADLTPVETQQARVTCQCIITHDITMHLHFIRVSVSDVQSPVECLLESVTERESIFTVLAEGCWLDALTEMSVVSWCRISQITRKLFDSFETGSALMEDDSDVHLFRSQFAEAMEMTFIQLTRSRIVIANETDGCLGTTTVMERLEEDTIVVLDCFTVFCIVEIDVTVDGERGEKEKNDHVTLKKHFDEMRVNVRETARVDRWYEIEESGLSGLIVKDTFVKSMSWFREFDERDK
jgi:hypothetical protein